MATKAKDVYTTLFDFGSNLDPEHNRTGTISELLTEINQNYNLLGGDQATLKSLKPTCDFLNKVAGITIRNTTDQTPLSTLKTIKLLFIVNHENKEMNLLSRIKTPTEARGPKKKNRNKSEIPSMESATTSSITRDKSAAAIIRHLSDQLAKEIGTEKLKSFSELMKNSAKQSTAEDLNAHIERTNDEIHRLFIGQFGNDNIRLADAWHRLAEEINRLNYTKVDDAEPPPLNEVIFAHLHGLGFIHFALHHRKFIKTILAPKTIHPIDTEVNSLCQSLGEEAGRTIISDDELFSVNDFQPFVVDYYREFIYLVKAATELDTRKITLFEHTLRARKILASLVYRRYGETDSDACRLSVFDIVAALCSVRYEQKVKTKYEPVWSGQVSQGKSPQAHFDKADSDDPYLHQGVFQIYLYRFSEYLAAFTKKTESNNAWMAYQLSRFDAYTRILQLNDINGIVASVHHLDGVCSQEAMSIADTYASVV